mmetsp:Transcript_110323/g.351898  ORF Transcript_110323/g.351898 Transcript_110323/m.351898 type:complete len:496 (+) Transcript_110323:3-1490(+)
MRSHAYVRVLLQAALSGTGNCRFAKRPSMEWIVADGGGRQNGADAEEGQRGALVLDVVAKGILQEERLCKEDLRDDEQEEARGIVRLADVEQVGDDRELHQVLERRRHVLGRVDPEDHGRGGEPQLPVTIHALEVVDNGNADGGHRVPQRESDDLRGDLPKCCLTSPPGQRDVAGAQGVAARKPVLFELQRGRRVDVGHEDADDGHAEDSRWPVALDVVQHPRQGEAQATQEQDLLPDLLLCDAAGGDGPVRLVDGVQVLVVPVVHCLGVADEHRPGQEHAEQELRILRWAGVEPVEVPAGAGPGDDPEDQRRPGYWLAELKPDLPQGLFLRRLGALHAEKLLHGPFISGSAPRPALCRAPFISGPAASPALCRAPGGAKRQCPSRQSQCRWDQCCSGSGASCGWNLNSTLHPRPEPSSRCKIAELDCAASSPWRRACWRRREGPGGGEGGGEERCGARQEGGVPPIGTRGPWPGSLRHGRLALLWRAPRVGKGG